MFSFLFSCKSKTTATIPRPKHLIIVIDENHKYDEIIGSPNAPYITSLSKEAALFTDSHGVIHPSQPNYLAFFSGSVQDVTDDRCLDSVTPYTTKNLGASLIAKGFTFKGYAQGLPSVGSKICRDSVSALTHGTVYGRKHCPWINWQGNGENNFPDSLSLPMTAFPKDFNQLPDVAFVIPDMDHDMHNIGKPGDSAAIKRGDDWLKENLSAYIEWAKTHNSMFILTFDEDDMTATNRIPTFIVGPQVKPGEYAEHINHFDVLRTLEKMYGLPPCVQDTSAHEITDVWK
ncbi:hypothetical protein A9P82_13880 [Arachidicoccus ginsenosidimutans]|nr:hypothetical protein A9P82_13880 [Arachidicoccus sp. BS20]